MAWWAEGRLAPILRSQSAPLAEGARLLAGFEGGGAVGKPSVR